MAMFKNGIVPLEIEFNDETYFATKLKIPCALHIHVAFWMTHPITMPMVQLVLEIAFISGFSTLVFVLKNDSILITFCSLENYEPPVVFQHTSKDYVDSLFLVWLVLFMVRFQ